MSENDFEATGDLHRIKEHTIEPGIVEGEIVEVDTDDYNVTIKKLTDGEPFTEPFATPESWSTDYRFVELVESHGYSSASAKLLEGDVVKVNVDTEKEQPELVISDDGFTRSEVQMLLLAIGWAGNGIVTLFLLPKSIGFVLMWVLLNAWLVSLLFGVEVDND